MIKRYAWCCGALLLFLNSYTFGFAQDMDGTASIPPKYEMRAAWIATVLNIDWPSRKGLPVEQQKTEYIQLITKLHNLGINAVFAQVRPVADAFYPSQYDPWSEYLMGKQGQVPEPFYDPLQFMIEETHKLGMEFHAWINPYRSVMNINTSSIAPGHITKTHPEWFVTYGAFKWFNPGLPESIKYVTGVIRDIINRYDVDGIHMDDYFYPYQEEGKPFNDQAAYAKYGNGLSLKDWRRANCDSAIKAIHETIQEAEPLVRFGIAPFGIYRNKRDDPDGSNTNGNSNYEGLYADITLWLRKGWIDYVAPQLYWEIGHPAADYRTLVEWWSRHTYGRHLYIGEGIYRTDENPNKAWRNPNELPSHIQLQRQYKNVKGSALFSSKSILRNPNGWADSLRENYFRKPAIVPPMDWIDKEAPPAPEIWADEKENSSTFQLYATISQPKNEEVIKAYVLYIASDPSRLGISPDQIVAVDNVDEVADILSAANILPEKDKKIYIAITALDRENNESDMSNILIFERQRNNNWKNKIGH